MYMTVIFYYYKNKLWYFHWLKKYNKT